MSSPTHLIGHSSALTEVVNAARLVATADVNVLISGETGTGKELLGRLIHDSGPRAEGPFVSLNCASLSAPLAESQMFGHCRGAFTDANRDHEGFVARAEGGTLFLDEVGELPLEVQAKLLRFLESGEYQPLGCGRTRHSGTRILAATNRDLSAEVTAGRFREDLYYRLAVVPLEMPPLRRRLEDLPELAAHFLADMARRHELAPARLGRRALARLAQHSWPGNLRELRNLCERLAIFLPGREVGPDNLPLELRPHGSAASFALPADGLDLAAVERDLIRQALKRTGGNQTRAARLLGLSRDTLIYRMKKYALRT